ncbi:peptidylprolyl isomerase [Chromobacterium sp. IIBBL 290-4]|uniref:peptidylprolyl isomerase n=1 Tax=Chromobacterium sp. IIBBL 290-4 TaxID=2953890 RepID=UPI0020B863AC|nr:peptidylprolyl isomerase [Chromobacterium sp. IIBBL 290-4]UTH73404.1 peptidylprolyl isomerase [Chromobacterium sp. IIBBL 290-4]
MKHSRIAALLLAASISLPAAAESIAVVNGTAIDKSALDAAVANVVQSNGGKVQDSPELREQLKGSLINREVILQEAVRRGLDKQPLFTKRLDELRAELLRDALFADIADKSGIGDAQIKARYDQLAAQVGNTKEVHAYQIMLVNKDDAQKVIAQLKKGSKFEDLVKTRSIDPASKQNGGDMSWGNLSQMDPKLAEALQKISKGQVSAEPYQSPAGWHVFKIADIRAAQVPPLEQIKPQLGRQLQEEAIAKAVEELRAKSKIQ